MEIKTKINQWAQTSLNVLAQQSHKQKGTTIYRLEENVILNEGMDKTIISKYTNGPTQ